jgi:hypothetical protein
LVLGWIEGDTGVQADDEGEIPVKGVPRLLLFLRREAGEEAFNCDVFLLHPARIRASVLP